MVNGGGGETPEGDSGDQSGGEKKATPTPLGRLGLQAKDALERSVADKDPDDLGLDGRIKGKLIKALTPKPEETNVAPASTTYSLLTTDQDRTKVRDLTPALKTPGLIGKWNGVFRVYQHHRIGRAVNRYLIQRGKLSAGGISFMAIFSLAGLATVGWTLFAIFFQSNHTFQEEVAETANSFIPGIVATSSDPSGLLDPNAMVVSTGTVVTGVAAFLVALWAASRVVRYLAEGMRSMFGLLPFPGRWMNMYPRYMLGLFLLLLAVLNTALLTLLSDHLLGWASDAFAIHPPLEHTITYDIATKAVPLLVNTLTFYVLVRVAAGIHVPSKTLWVGSAAFALASSLLGSVSGSVIGATSNPVTAAATTVVTILVWVNILSRIALVICAWMADPPAMVTKVDAESIHSKSEPNYVSACAPHTLDWPYHPITGDLIPARVLTVPQAEQALVDAAEEQTSLGEAGGGAENADVADTDTPN